VKTSNNRFHNY